MTRLASISYGVGVSFKITSFAPARRATSGSIFAGDTCKEEPITKKRSALRVSSKDLSHGTRGSISPKKTAFGLSTPPHSLQRGGFSPEITLSITSSIRDIKLQLRHTACLSEP